MNTIQTDTKSKQYKISDLAEIQDSKRIPVSAMERSKRKGIFPYYGASGVVDYIDDYLFDGDFILISEDGENLNTRKTPIAFPASGKFWVNNHAHIIKPKEDYLNEIIVNYFSQLDIQQFITGAVQPKLSQENLLQIPIYLPEDEISQKKLSTTLAIYRKKIDLLFLQNKTLEELAQIHFLKLFDGSGDNNRGVLDDYVSFDPREKIDRNKEYCFFDMKTLSDNSMTIQGGVYRATNSASSFRNFDTLLAKITPCLENGKTGFVMDLEDKEIARGSTEFVVMRSKGIVSPYWIYCLARSDSFRDEAIQSMTGTSGRQRVQTSQLKNIEVAFNDNDMKAFHGECEVIFNKIKVNSSQIRTISSFRDMLLPKLFNGEIGIN